MDKSQLESGVCLVLSPEEIARMIEAAPNLMHRTILMLLYATGIRRAEASLLKVSDINSERMVIHILQEKGSRDRDDELLAGGGGLSSTHEDFGQPILEVLVFVYRQG